MGVQRAINASRQQQSGGAGPAIPSLPSWSGLEALEPAAEGTLRLIPAASFPGATAAGDVLVRRGAARWAATSDAAILAYIASHSIPNSSPATDFTYILPSSANFDNNWRLDTRSSYKLKIKPTGPANTFRTVEIAMPNTGAAYQIRRAYIMRSGNANTVVTENTATGLATITASPVTIAGGTDAEPVWTPVGVVVTMDSPVADCVLLIECEAGCLGSFWGDFATPGMGWVVSNEELLNTTLSDEISLAGGSSWGTIPPVGVKFGGLSTSVTCLPFGGDSWMDGFGDIGPRRPYGLEGRLDAAWAAAGVPIAPFMFGRTGFTTPQTVSRIRSLLSWFNVNAIVVQFNSLNDTIQGLDAGTCRTSWQEIEEIAGYRKILPICGGGMTSSISGWWANWLADQAWMVARNPDTDIHYLDNLVNPSTGEVQPGFVYTEDQAHPSSPGYGRWRIDSGDHMRDVVLSWNG